MRGFTTRRIVRSFVAGAALFVSMFAVSAKAAPTQVIYDLTTGSTTTVATEFGSGDGNSYEFFDPVSGVGLDAYAWSDVGGRSFTASEVTRFGTGAGVCNPSEDISIFVFTLPCKHFRGPRSIDNAGGLQDWMLFILHDDSVWQELTLMGAGDTDVHYAIGTINTRNLEGMTYSEVAALGFNPAVAVTDGSTTIDLGGVSGNALLIGSLFGDTDDAFTVSSVTTLVPIPAPVYLMGSALIALFARRRKPAVA